MVKLKRILAITLILLLAGSCSKKVAAPASMEEGKIVLSNCTIIDGTGAESVEGKRIFIKDGIIEKIVTEEKSDIPDGYQQIDLGGAVVLPGFINTHVHCMFSEEALKTWLLHGVTTVREMAARDGTDFIGDRDRLNQNNGIARIVTSTPPLTAPGGYIPPLGVAVASKEEAAKKTQECLDMNPDVIKIAVEDDLQGKTWNMLTEEEIKSITDTAHAGGKRVAAHISHARNLPLAIEGGVDELSHMVVEPVSQDIVDEIVKKGIYWIPTLELWKGISSRYGGDWEKNAISNLSLFYKEGGLIALGTDYNGFNMEFDGGMPITEIELMKEAGMSNMDIIIAATKNASVVCGMETQIGTLEAGKIADIIVVKEDPLKDLKALESVYMIIHNGSIAVTYDERTDTSVENIIQD
ncbi:MAG: amidohydrolase family protein [Mobilitalea sp.]